MKIGPRIERVREIAAREGLGGLTRAVLHYGRGREFSVYRRDLHRPEGEAPARGDVRPGCLQDLRRWRREQGAVAAPFTADRTAGWSDFCWAWVGNQVVGVVWTTTTSPLLATEDGEAVIVDLYTVPSFRGQGIATALVATACRQLKQKGVGAVYATIERQNTPSRRAFERSGFAMVGQFTSRGWLRRPARTARWTGMSRTGECQ